MHNKLPESPIWMKCLTIFKQKVINELNSQNKGSESPDWSEAKPELKLEHAWNENMPKNRFRVQKFDDIKFFKSRLETISTSMTDEPIQL